jgi:hypothetical protein
MRLRFLLLLVLAIPAVARADDKKSGTFDLSGGPNIVFVESHHGTSSSGPDQAPTLKGGGLAFDALGVGVGYFIRPYLSVTLRASHQFVLGGTHLAFHGATVQWYPHRRFFLGVGPGLVNYGGPGAFAAQANDPTDRAGFGMHFRAGVTLLDGRRHAMNLYLQMFPGFFRDSLVVGSGIGLEWQLR